MALADHQTVRTVKPRAGLLLALMLVAALAVSLVFSHALSGQVLAAAARLRSLGAAGWMIFIAVQALIALIGILPASLLGIAAGAVYGIGQGFLTSALGIMAGAIIAFWLSRSLMRPLIAGLLGRRRRLAAFDTIVTQDSWRIVALLRVSPIMPFSLTSYALGLSGISAQHYLTGTLASLPALLGYVTIGALGSSSLMHTQHDATIHATLLLAGAAATLVLTVHVSRLLAKALKAKAVL